MLFKGDEVIAKNSNDSFAQNHPTNCPLSDDVELHSLFVPAAENPMEVVKTSTSQQEDVEDVANPSNNAQIKRSSLEKEDLLTDQGNFRGLPPTCKDGSAQNQTQNLFPVSNIKHFTHEVINSDKISSLIPRIGDNPRAGLGTIQDRPSNPSCILSFSNSFNPPLPSTYSHTNQARTAFRSEFTSRSSSNLSDTKTPGRPNTPLRQKTDFKAAQLGSFSRREHQHHLRQQGNQAKYLHCTPVRQQKSLPPVFPGSYFFSGQSTGKMSSAGVNIQSSFNQTDHCLGKTCSKTSSPKTNLQPLWIFTDNAQAFTSLQTAALTTARTPDTSRYYSKSQNLTLRPELVSNFSKGNLKSDGWHISRQDTQATSRLEHKRRKATMQKSSESTCQEIEKVAGVLNAVKQGLEQEQQIELLNAITDFGRGSVRREACLKELRNILGEHDNLFNVIYEFFGKGQTRADMKNDDSSEGNINTSEIDDLINSADVLGLERLQLERKVSQHHSPSEDKNSAGTTEIHYSQNIAGNIHVNENNSKRSLLSPPLENASITYVLQDPPATERTSAVVTLRKEAASPTRYTKSPRMHASNQGLRKEKAQLGERCDVLIAENKSSPQYSELFLLPTRNWTLKKKILCQLRVRQFRLQNRFNRSKNGYQQGRNHRRAFEVIKDFSLETSEIINLTRTAPEEYVLDSPRKQGRLDNAQLLRMILGPRNLEVYVQLMDCLLSDGSQASRRNQLKAILSKMYFDSERRRLDLKLMLEGCLKRSLDDQFLPKVSCTSRGDHIRAQLPSNSFQENPSYTLAQSSTSSDMGITNSYDLDYSRQLPYYKPPEVLNNTHVLDASSIDTRTRELNKYESALINVEEMRTELDRNISLCSETALRLSNILDRIRSTEETDEDFTFQLKKMSPVHWGFLRKTYGNKNRNILAHVYKGSEKAIIVVLSRLENLRVEYERLKAVKNVEWREVVEENYHRALDTRCRDGKGTVTSGGLTAKGWSQKIF